MKLPPGFRFHPTDEELIICYLHQKVVDNSFTAEAIGEVDLNRCEPWDLPGKAKMGENEWYFFTVRDRKYPSGLRTNRATEAGYWKATGKDREIRRGGSSLVGMKKTLVFYKGRAPKGEKSEWVMHEYRLEGKLSPQNLSGSSSSSRNEWVIGRVFHKNAAAAAAKCTQPHNPPEEQEDHQYHDDDVVEPSSVENPASIIDNSSPNNTVTTQQQQQLQDDTNTMMMMVVGQPSSAAHVPCFSAPSAPVNIPPPPLFQRTYSHGGQTYNQIPVNYNFNHLAAVNNPYLSQQHQQQYYFNNNNNQALYESSSDIYHYSPMVGPIRPNSQYAFADYNNNYLNNNNNLLDEMQLDAIFNNNHHAGGLGNAASLSQETLLSGGASHDLNSNAAGAMTPSMVSNYEMGAGCQSMGLGVDDLELGLSSPSDLLDLDSFWN